VCRVLECLLYLPIEKGITMKDRIRIVQQNICVDHQNMENNMILLFTENNKIVGVSVVVLPEWLKFYDEDYNYYPFCNN
jgi:hypothetical protein